MGLNNIELPDSVITELYGNKLVIPTASPAPPPQAPARASSPVPTATTSAPAAAAPASPTPTTPAPYKFLGNNQKKITILVDSPDATFLPDDQLAFLTKMLE